MKIAQCYLSLNDRAKAIMFFYKGNIISQEIQILFLLELYFTIHVLSHPSFFFFPPNRVFCGWYSFVVSVCCFCCASTRTFRVELGCVNWFMMIWIHISRPPLDFYCCVILFIWYLYVYKGKSFSFLVIQCPSSLWIINLPCK